jgi:cellulose synthase/poly-beta-1,6-N-acetylglucosamine synthase-like glycosyltransferase
LGAAIFYAVDAVALLRAVLADHCPSDDAARQHLAACTARGIDPLDYCAHDFGLGNRETWARAARWAGYPFVPALPAQRGDTVIDRLDALADARSIRTTIDGHAVTLVAPRFAHVLGLRGRGSLAHVRFAPPDAIERALASAASEQLMDNARQRMSLLWPRASAADLPRHVRIAFAVLVTATIVLAMLAGAILRPFLIPVVAAVLMAPGMLRLAAALPQRPPAEPAPLSDRDLPFYTVLIPLRDEAHMVPLLRQAMGRLDYPSHLLDIKFVVEARSPQTVRAVENVLGDPRFRIIEVPPGPPNTKPKALDYALPFARGEFIVVYDAEDVPDADQLRRAATRFRADPALACLQAELVPENAHENPLTALFAGEYAGLFGRLLPALARWKLPVPLGGTSNHFRTAVLRSVGGWDAFNVTEDADLGVRLARRAHRAEAFTSRTHEEAPLTVRAWMAQRTRWMKGWMQTYCVHNRAPLQLLRDLGWRGFLGFQILVGGMIVSSLLHTVFLGSVTARLMFEGLVGFVPVDAWDLFALGIIGAGYGGAVALVISGLIHQRALHLAVFQLLLPAYWLLHSIATLYAVIELITAPSHWAKTTHGVTRVARVGVERSGAEHVAGE